MRYTLQDLRNKLVLLGAFPVDYTTAQQNAFINEALESFILDGRFLGTKQEIQVVVSNTGFFTLPREFLTCLGIRVNQNVREMASIWYNYLSGDSDISQFGTNIQDRGDGWVTFDDPVNNLNLPFTTSPATVAPLYAGAQLRIACTGETATTVEFHGLDQNGMEIYTGNQRGALYTFNAAKSGPYFSKVTQAFIPLTANPAYLYACYDDGTETCIGLYAPGETEPNYRRYFVQEATINGVPAGSSAPLAAYGLINTAVAAAGSGYAVNDIITIVGGTVNIGLTGTAVPAKLEVTSIGGGGTITGVRIYSPGNYAGPVPINPVAVSGGLGTGATFTLSWMNTGLTTVTALLQRRHVDLVADTDICWCSNFRAMKLGVRSMHWQREGDEARMNADFNQAIEFLNKELMRSRPPSEVGAMRISARFGGATGLYARR